MKILSILSLLLIFPVIASATGNHRVTNFSKAKKLASQIHEERKITLYCQCTFKSKEIDLNSCGYKPQKDKKRAARLEWEHVVPAEAFGNSFAEWREPLCSRKGRKFKGRKCAESNPEFSRMEADLYNLFPEIGELNGLRSNLSMAAIPLSPRQVASKKFGDCNVKLEDRKFEPNDLAKGVVARTYLYMDGVYPGRGIISEKNQKLFEAWDKMYPAAKWECDRAKKIEFVQGNKNEILASRCASLAK